MHPDWDVDPRLAYETPWWRIHDDAIVRPDGGQTTYIWAQTTNGRGAVMCIPRTEDGRYLLIRIYRHPMKRYTWEFVAGLIDGDESPERAAAREVEEETGVRPVSVRVYPPYVPISGFVGDQFHIALATIPDVNIEDLALQSEEGIVEAQFASSEDLRQMVRRGEIEDGITLVALAHHWAGLE